MAGAESGMGHPQQGRETTPDGHTDPGPLAIRQLMRSAGINYIPVHG